MSASCNCGGCVSRGLICVARGDNVDIVFNILDENGSPYDITGADQIIFIVAEGTLIGGNVSPGGDILIDKRLTTSGISIAGTGYQFVVTLNPSDTADVDKTNLYYEARVTNSNGMIRTVGNGVFVAQDTMIKDL